MKSLIYKLFQSLKGRWFLQRKIPNYGIFEGYASFKKAADNQEILFYKEEGTLKLTSGVEVTASKEYVYCYQAPEDQISAFFLENDSYNKLFHTLKFASNIEETYPIQAKGYHRCINDNYNAEYNFLSLDEFSLTYQVHGPHKHYASTSFFKRVNETNHPTTDNTMPHGNLTTNNQLD